jgi:cytoskeleton protein RodZ
VNNKENKVAVLNMLQEEQLKEIGTHLRQVRQQKSISIEEVAARTCIRLRMLKALEDGLLDQLPEPIYIQGFIRRYGDFLGLDGNDLAKDFSTDYPPVEFDAGAILGIGRSQKPESNIAVEPIIEEAPIVSEITPPTPVPTSTKSKPAYIPIVLFGLVAIGGLFYVFFRPRTVEPVGSQQTLPATQQPQAETRPISPSPVASTPIKTPVAITSPTPTPVPIELSPSSDSSATEQLSTEPTASPTIPTTTALNPTPTPTEPVSIEPTPSPTIPETTAVNPTPSPTELPSSIPLSNTTTTGPVQVSVNLQGESWVRVMVDGKTAFEGILQPGTQQTWAGQEKVTIRSGNAGAVLVSVNQNTAQPLGRLGAVREQTFTAGQQ